MRLTVVAFWPRRTSTPRSRSDSATCSPAKGSSRAISAVGRLDQRDLRAEGAPRLGHLHAHHAAAEDGQARRRRLGGGDLAVGPRLGLAQPVDRRDQRAAAGRHHHRLLGHERVVAGRDAPLAVEAAVLADQLDARGSRATGAGTESSRSWITSSRRASADGHVEIAGRPPAAAPGHAPDLGQQLARAQQRLGGHAGVDRSTRRRSAPARRSPPTAHRPPAGRRPPRRRARRRSRSRRSCARSCSPCSVTAPAKSSSVPQSWPAPFLTAAAARRAGRRAPLAFVVPRRRRPRHPPARASGRARRSAPGCATSAPLPAREGQVDSGVGVYPAPRTAPSGWRSRAGGPSRRPAGSRAGGGRGGVRRGRRPRRGERPGRAPARSRRPA